MISICQWNINGLTCDKLIEIQPHLNKLDADIIILSETWLKPNVTFNVDLTGYKSLNFPRPCKHRKARRNSGGLLIYIKDYLSPLTECTKKSSDRVWIKLKQTSSMVENDIHICATYIPPHASSSYSLNEPPWTDLQREIIHFDKMGPVVLIGDLNARIGDFQPNPNGKFNRVFKDKTVNSYGLDLMSICTGSDLLICNGTLPPDNATGDYTCHTANGSSCVDYAIVNSHLVSKIKSFCINKLETFSDHCPIVLTLSTGSKYPEHSKHSVQFLTNQLYKDLTDRLDVDTANYQNRFPPKLKWFKENKNKFLDTLKQCPPTSNTPLLTLDTNKMVTSFTEKIIQHAIDSGFAKVPSTSESHPSKRLYHRKHPFQWFDDDCKIKKKEVFSKLAAWRKNPSNQDLQNAYHNSKAAWKKLIRTKKGIALQKWNTEILKKARSNPKTFWNAVNLNSKPKADNNISCSEWEQYFSQLYSSTPPHQTENNYQLTDPISPDQTNTLRANPSISQEPDISTEEISSAISNLKGGKAPGIDLITNEVLKSLPLSWIESLQKIFNAILQSGEYPSIWAESIIKPIHKSGNREVPSNYRGISLISCLGKLFTAILRDRMITWAQDLHLLPEEQFGFQKGKRTSDSIFVLHTLAKRQRFLKKKLYCCFVDLRKAFDSISHHLLWSKLKALNLDPQILKLLQSYYSKSRSCVQGSQGCTKFFATEKGVKQGCNLSPLLFSLYIHDLPKHLHSSEDKLPYFPSTCLLFADDIVLFTDDPRKLQNQINSLHLYCWHKYLEINSDKTKILVFGQKSTSVTDSWEIGSKSLEIVNKYKYLGTWLCWNCDYKECVSQINKKANKSLCNLQTKIVSLGITNVNILLTLFNTLIKPILIYNSEIWGLDDVHQLEKIQCKYLKFVLRVSNSSVNTAVLAETGTPPLSHDCVSAVLKYFYRITSPDTSFLIRQACEISNGLNSIDYTSWIHRVKTKLLHLGFNLDFVSPSREAVLSRLHDQTIQQFRSDIDCTQGLTPSGGSKLRTYRLIKPNTFEPEPYLSMISNPMVRQAVTKFRISDHKLAIEIGRHCRPPKPVEDRTCSLCNSQSVEDEIHFLIHCSAYDFIRFNLFQLATNLNHNFRSLSSTDKFIFLMRNKNKSIIERTSNFIHKAMQHRYSLMSPNI